MSATEFDAGEERAVFKDSDNAVTEMDYDTGGVPLYVAVVWVVFLACYVTYMVMYRLPAFSG